jgi:hypothetical protein
MISNKEWHMVYASDARMQELNMKMQYERITCNWLQNACRSLGQHCCYEELC